MSTTKKTNNKRTMLIFIAAFSLPVILAKLALDNGWFNQAATNKGELLDPILDMNSLQESQSEPLWKLVFILPEQCEATCENALYSIAQVHSALGKHSDRAEVLVLTHENSDRGQLTSLQKQPNYRLVDSSLEAIEQVFKNTNREGIFIADTLNNIFLRYPLQVDPKEAILHSRDILSDMRKVLKLSRIG